MSSKTFTKDGHTLTVSSARDEVRLRFDGWVEGTAEPEPEPVESDAAPAKATAKKSSK